MADWTKNVPPSPRVLGSTSMRDAFLGQELHLLALKLHLGTHFR